MLRYVALGLYNVLLQSECVGDDCFRHQEAVIRRVTVHPNYGKDPRNNNIALVELQFPANLTNPHIGPICMPFVKELQKSKPLNLVVTSEEYFDLRSKQLTELAPSVCQRQLAQEGFLTSVKNVPWCAVDSDNRGQSPLMLNAGAALQALLQFDDQQLYFLRGVNLRNNLPNELPYLPELFTNVDRFLDWIVDNMKFKELEALWPTATKGSVTSREVRLKPIKHAEKRRLFNFTDCGRMSVSNETMDSNIIPWMGYLASDQTHLNATKDTRCAVTLISEWYVVGLAVCFSSNSTEYSVLFGINSVNGLKECTECVHPTQTIPVQKIIIHPRYSNSDYDNDIALAKLARPVDTSRPHVKPICLPLMDEVRSYDTSSLVAVSENEEGSHYLLAPIDDRYVDSTECQKRWVEMGLQFAIENVKICAQLERAPNNECFDLLTGASLHTIQPINTEDRHFLRGILEIKSKVCSSYFPLGAENVTDESSFTKSLAVLISEWYAIVPKRSVTSNISWRLMILGKYNPDDPTNCYTSTCEITHQMVEIKNVIVPPIDHPRQMLALIELLEPANLKLPYISPICLPFMQQLQRKTPTEVTISSNKQFAIVSKKLTMIDYLNCQQRLLLATHFVTFDGDFPCAIEAEKFRQVSLPSSLGSPLQMPVRMGGRARYFLYGMDTNEENIFSDLVYGPYLFGTIEPADLDWIVENMQFKERNTSLPIETRSADRERVSLAPMPDTSKRNLFNFNTCGINTLLSESYGLSSLVMSSTKERTSDFTVTRIENRYLHRDECQQRWNGLAVSFTVDNMKSCIITKRSSDDKCVGVFTGAALHTLQRVQSSDRHFLRGYVLILPRGCSVYYPAVYTNTEHYLSWMLENMDEPLFASNGSADLRDKLIFT
uniref:Peptidase S1 domain-containing protein n=1 Tax=Anopheles stephensi TaxID=30069 RepID=A0A182Y1U1_ANOST